MAIQTLSWKTFSANCYRFNKGPMTRDQALEAIPGVLGSRLKDFASGHAEHVANVIITGATPTLVRTARNALEALHNNVPATLTVIGAKGGSTAYQQCAIAPDGISEASEIQCVTPSSYRQFLDVRFIQLSLG